jgi:hypothetical protein
VTLSCQLGSVTDCSSVERAPKENLGSRVQIPPGLLHFFPSGYIYIICIEKHCVYVTFQMWFHTCIFWGMTLDFEEFIHYTKSFIRNKYFSPEKITNTNCCWTAVGVSRKQREYMICLNLNPKKISNTCWT